VWIGQITHRKAQTVSAWTRDELDKIGAADELELASLRSDAALQEPVTIWVVRHGDNLYVRSMKGRKGLWYQRTQMRHQGNIRAGGVEKDVTFVDAGHQLDDQLDAAYRDKYHQYGARYVDPIVSAEARGTTIKLIPR
jgi:hypothetical protein